ncbi:MAG: tetratricopeptide repeat protein [bacterium]|nr:tetratricopeptide repeat protein [bacterium]
MRGGTGRYCPQVAIIMMTLNRKLYIRQWLWILPVFFLSLVLFPSNKDKPKPKTGKPANPVKPGVAGPVKPGVNPSIKELEKKLKTVTDKEKIKLLDHFSRNNWDKYPAESFKYAGMALGLARKLEDQNEITRALSNIGTGHFYSGRNHDAIEYYIKALKLAEISGDVKKQGKALNNIGIIYWKMKNYDKALEYLLRALKLKKKTGNSRSLASTVNNIGLVYTKKKEYEKALEYFREAIKLYRDAAYRKGLGTAFTNMGNVYFESDNFPKALEYYNQSLNVYKGLAFEWGIVNTSKNIGRLYTKKGDYQKALSFLKPALDLAQEIKSKDMIQKSYNALAILYEAKGDFQNSLAYFKKFTALKESVFNEKSSEQISRLEARYNLQKKEGEIQLLRKDNKIRKLLFVFLGIAFLLLLGLAIVSHNRYKTKKRINKQLRISEAKYRMLFHEAGDAIFLLEKEVFVDCNEKGVEFFGVDKNQIVGQTFKEFSPPAQQDHQNSLEKGRKKTSRAFQEERQFFYWEHTRKDGSPLHAMVSLNKIVIDDKKLVQAIVHDITEHRQLEEERLRTAKLESIGILAGGIAHDFNNLLAVITGNAGIGRLLSKPGDKIDKTLEKIENSASAAIDLANQFLTFSEGGHPIKKELSITGPVNDSIKAVLNETPYKIKCPEKLWSVDCDIEQISRVLEIIATNAIEAVNENGNINVTVANINLESEEIPLEEGKYVSITIEDNGIGIPAGNLPKIFDPYFSTRQNISRKGTGLGLSIAHSIIKRHNGYIDVKSTVTKGTTVTIYIPASK